MATLTAQKSAMDAAVRHLVDHYNPKGNRVGWLMMASILVEAWDLYGIAFVLIFIRDQYHPDPLLLGLAAAGTQGGALVGALLGGWLTDRIGRRFMFLATMVMFIVLAVAQAFVTSVAALAVVRLFLGVPLGSDISTGYTYIMDAMAKGEREVMGNRWQFMFAVGEVLTLAVIAVFLIFNLDHEWVWRVTLGLGALPALVILILRHDLPETAVWLIRQGRLREAKRVALQMYDDPLDMLPDQDVEVAQTARGRIPQGYSPGSDPLARDALRMDRLLRPGQRILDFRLLSAGAVRDGGRLVDPRHDFRHHGALCDRRHLGLGRPAAHAQDRPSRHQHRRLRHRASSRSWLPPPRSTRTARFVLPFAAAAMLWGHYWDASNCMTIPSLVAKPEYRGTASGFAYMFVKLPSFLAIFLFPSIFAAIGQANATLLVAVFPLIGLMAAIFILPEVYGFEHD